MNVRLLLSFAALSAVSLAAPSVVDRHVHRSLEEFGKADVIVTMKASKNVAESFEEGIYPNRVARIEALKTELEKTSAEALKPLAGLLSQESSAAVEMKMYWIAPRAFIKDVTPELLAKIAALPGVESVRPEKRLAIAKPIIESGVPEAVTGQEWGVKRIGAPQVWADGTTGQGIVVGAIDTGARATHDILKRNFVGKYGWFDPEKKAAKPYDGNGHGSHVLGTIAGANGFGVAPAAKWMMCKGCRTDDCPESDLLDCAQFILCPTDTDGKNPDCSKAPRIVSNSWGGGQGDFWYKPAVDAWVKAGIIPVFAQGNEGDLGCGSASSPGDYPNVIGVGSTTILDALSWFSSVGPTVNGRIKPDISAPGSKIKSSWNTSDSDYLAISGTSMATPHVSGAIALLLSQNPELTADEIKVLLYTTTDQQGLIVPPVECGTTKFVNWPNNMYGHGRLNIFNAYQGFRPAPTPRPTTVPTPTTVAPVPTTAAPVTTAPAPTTAAPKPTTAAPVPTTAAPVPTSKAPEPTTKAPVPSCPTASGAQCGSESEGAKCCPEGEYCQPWNPWFYQCRPAPKQCGAVEVNVDYYGDDIKTIKGVFAWDCCDACAKTPGCQAFTFVNYNADGQSACYLKKGSGDKRKLVGAVSSTVTTPLPKCTTVSNTDFYGEDLKRVETKDAAACCDACAATEGCKAFTFVDNAWDKSACYLKKAVGKQTKYDGAVSGTVN